MEYVINLMLKSVFWNKLKNSLKKCLIYVRILCISLYAAEVNRLRIFRGIAQLVEHRSPKPGVVSSNLTAPASLVLVDI